MEVSTSEVKNINMKEDNTWKKILVVIGLASSILLLSSCGDNYCEDCYTIRYSNGATEWVCVEYICDGYER